jgi:hypothetical protein
MQQATRTFTALALAGLVALSPLAPAAHAQPTGCTPGTAQAILDVNGVHAGLYNAGNLFFAGGDPQYEVPQGSGIHSMFAAALWVGGTVNGEIRTAAATYAQGSEDYEFFPGPLDDAGNPPADCAPYDRIWVVSLEDIETYDQTGVATPDLEQWPGDLGAPFTDANGDGAYNLADGDRPDITGEEMAWWVMNDAAGPHLTTLSVPIGLEVRASAFATSSTEPALQYATFYRYEIEYRGTAPFENAYVTFWADPDLGDFGDDYIGSDPDRDLGFVYNADNDDGPFGYGPNPPAQGARLLETPENLGMTRFGYYNNNSDPRTGNPDTDQDYYNYMRGLWRDGTPWTEGGDGTSVTGNPVQFMYPNSGSASDPVPGYWSEVCPTPDCAQPIVPFDRRFTMSTGPLTMEPGDTAVVAFGLVWARAGSNFESLQAMKAASDIAAAAYANGLVVASEPDAPPPNAYALAAYPSPFADAATIRLTVPERPQPVRVAVYDALGREVAVLAKGPLPAGAHALRLDGGALPAGVYVVRVEGPERPASLRVVHVE